MGESAESLPSQDRSRKVRLKLCKVEGSEVISFRWDSVAADGLVLGEPLVLGQQKLCSH